MTIEALCWAVEYGCQNAWPSLKHVLLEGWLLRASNGLTRRTNSVNPLRCGPHDPTPIISCAETIYSSLGQPTIFRIPSFIREAEAPLISRGYSSEGQTYTLLVELAAHKSKAGKNIELANAPSDEWKAAWASLNGASERTKSIYNMILETILLPTIFASCRVDGKLVSIAYGAIHQKLLIVESVATDPTYRRRGHGTSTVGSLLDWAKEKGAEAGCLQVQADNLAGQALYRSLGFEKEVYQYRYWKKDTAVMSSRIP